VFGWLRAIRIVSGSGITFHVKGNFAGIYVLDGPGKIGADGVFLR